MRWNGFGSLYVYPGSVGRQTDNYNTKYAVHDFTELGFTPVVEMDYWFLCCYTMCFFLDCFVSDLPEGYHQPCIFYPIQFDYDLKKYQILIDGLTKKATLVPMKKQTGVVVSRALETGIKKLKLKFQNLYTDQVSNYNSPETRAL